jgi:hypothetical protein
VQRALCNRWETRVLGNEAEIGVRACALREQGRTSSTVPGSNDPRLRVLRDAEILWVCAQDEPTPRAPECEAFAALYGDTSLLTTYATTLLRLVNEGSPAARLYAAMLMNRVDPVAGRRALRSLITSTVAVSVQVGSLSRSSTVGEVARLLGTRLGALSFRLL